MREFTKISNCCKMVLLRDEDSDSEDGNHSQVQTDCDQKPCYELAGHPLPCSGKNLICQSKL